MICVGTNCDKCKNKTELIDNWLPACRAFPNGIPLDFYGNPEGEKCNNDIGYEPDPHLVKVFDFGAKKNAGERF